MSKTMRQVFGEALIRFAGEFPNMVVLDADVSSSTQTKLFQAAHPDRFFNFGIAEGNMAAAAAGMASCGLTPVISTFAFLLSVRAMDAIHSLAAYNNLNVKICGDMPAFQILQTGRATRRYAISPLCAPFPTSVYFPRRTRKAPWRRFTKCWPQAARFICGFRATL